MNVRVISPATWLYLLSFAISPITTLKAQTSPQPAGQAGASTQDSANDLVVAVGKSVLVDSTRTIERVAIGSSELAEATAISPTEVLVNGKVAGETSLILWQAGGNRQFFNVRVRANSYVANDRLEALRREIRTELPGQSVQLTSENGLIFLHGTVKDLNSSDRVVQIASTAGKIVNLLNVNVPAADPQILLKVRFASVDRSVQRQLGANYFSNGTRNTVGSLTTQQFSPPTISSSGSGTASSTVTTTLSSLLNFYIFNSDLNIGATLEALETQGLLQVLAEPNLLTANGKQGSFLAGGEFPYAVLQGTGSGTGAVTIQFREFGVRLNFIPTITPRGSIRLQVAPEVSSLDFANGLTISGFTIPALSTRKVKTEVELKEGQSFVIGGLLDNRETKNFSKVPFIGDIPVLGKFFQSISKTRSNTELIVIVTPEIVAPIPAGAPVPTLNYPDKFLRANSGIPMTNPGADVTGAKTVAPAPLTMPVEQLVQSLKSEQPLNLNAITPGVIFTEQQTAPAPATGSAPATPSSPAPQ